jgi:hypothetical protein
LPNSSISIEISVMLNCVTTSVIASTHGGLTQEKLFVDTAAADQLGPFHHKCDAGHPATKNASLARVQLLIDTPAQVSKCEAIACGLCESHQ